MGDKKFQRTSVITTADLDRFGGTVKYMRDAWDNLPDDVNLEEREIFIELSSQVLTMQNLLYEKEKNTDNLN